MRAARRRGCDDDFFFSREAPRRLVRNVKKAHQPRLFAVHTRFRGSTTRVEERERGAVCAEERAFVIYAWLLNSLRKQLSLIDRLERFDSLFVLGGAKVRSLPSFQLPNLPTTGIGPRSVDAREASEG